MCGPWRRRGDARLCAWSLAAVMSGLRWLRTVALGCFATAVAIAFLVDRPEVFLAFAVALLALVALPGWLLMRGEPSNIV